MSISQPLLYKAIQALNALAPEAGDVRLGTLLTGAGVGAHRFAEGAPQRGAQPALCSSVRWAGWHGRFTVINGGRQ
jgi:hypothetical protein